MACLNPLWIVNPKYRKMCGHYDSDRTYCKKVFSKSMLPEGVSTINEFGVDDFMISVPCGRCICCRRKIANEWKVRLLHEINYHLERGIKMYFITLTLSDDYYEDAKKDHYIFIRKWLEKYRYKTGESLRHFIVTELGEKKGRLHYHGIVFGSKLSSDDLLSLWTWSSDKCKFAGYVQNKTASYIVKYMLKPCDWEFVSDWYTPRRYVSRGLGKCYCDDPLNVSLHNRGECGVWYITNGKFKMPIPRYYRDRLFSEETIYNSRKWFYDHPPKTWSINLPSCTEEYDDFNFFVIERKKCYDDSVKRRMSLPDFGYNSSSWRSNLVSDEFEVENLFVQPFVIYSQSKNLLLWDC